VTAPRVSGAWMLQHARRMRSDPLGFLVDCAAEQGDIVEFPIPRQRVFFVNDPDAVGRVLQGNHRAYGKGTLQYRSLSVVTGQGLLVSEGQTWLRGRRMVQPAFHHSTLQALAAQVAAAAERLIVGWDALAAGSDVDVDAAMMHATLEVVGQALFSTDLGPSAAELVAAVVAALDRVAKRARSPLPLPLGWPSPGNLRLRAALATLDARVDEMVGARRRLGSARADLLGLLLSSSEAGGPGGQDAEQQVRDQVVTLIVAGHETVASALTWAWWLVAGDAAVAGRLAQESRDVLGGRPATLEDYPRLVYTRAVLDEALRLFPPAWLVTRRVLADDVLAQQPVPAGSLVIVSPYALHRNPRVWTAPQAFDPGRFLPGADPAPRRGYLPFGAGPRMCVGREFALVEGVLLLAAVAGRFSLSRRPGQTVVADPLVTVRPRGGLQLVLGNGL
jgi:cytochrome P450